MYLLEPVHQKCGGHCVSPVCIVQSRKNYNLQNQFNFLFQLKQKKIKNSCVCVCVCVRICINFYFLKLKKENKKPPPHRRNIKIVDNESIGIFFCVVAPFLRAYLSRVSYVCICVMYYYHHTRRNVV